MNDYTYLEIFLQKVITWVICGFIRTYRAGGEIFVLLKPHFDDCFKNIFPFNIGSRNHSQILPNF